MNKEHPANQDHPGTEKIPAHSRRKFHPASRSPGYVSMPNGWLAGLLDTLLELESENNRLQMALIRAEALLREKQMPGKPGSNS